MPEPIAPPVSATVAVSFHIEFFQRWDAAMTVLEPDEAKRQGYGNERVKNALIRELHEAEAQARNRQTNTMRQTYTSTVTTSVDE